MVNGIAQNYKSKCEFRGIKQFRVCAVHKASIDAISAYQSNQTASSNNSTQFISQVKSQTSPASATRSNQGQVQLTNSNSSQMIMSQQFRNSTRRGFSPVDSLNTSYSELPSASKQSNPNIRQYVSIRPKNIQRDRIQSVVPQTMSDSTYNDNNSDLENQFVKTASFQNWRSVPKVLRCLQQSCCHVLKVFLLSLEASCGADGTKDLYETDDYIFGPSCDGQGLINHSKYGHKLNKDVHLETLCLECGTILNDLSKPRAKFMSGHMADISLASIGRMPNFPVNLQSSTLSPQGRPKDSYVDMSDSKKKKNFVPLPDFDSELPKTASVNSIK